MHADYSKYCQCPECRSYDRQEWGDYLLGAAATVILALIVYGICVVPL